MNLNLFTDLTRYSANGGIESMQFWRNPFILAVCFCDLIIFISVGTCRQNGSWFCFSFDFASWVLLVNAFVLALCVEMSHLSSWIGNSFILHRILKHKIPFHFEDGAGSSVIVLIVSEEYVLRECNKYQIYIFYTINSYTFYIHVRKRSIFIDWWLWVYFYDKTQRCSSMAFLINTCMQAKMHITNISFSII